MIKPKGVSSIESWSLPSYPSVRENTAITSSDSYVLIYRERWEVCAMKYIFSHVERVLR